MRKILTSLIIALAVSGCGKTTGMASQDLEPVFITVRLEGPASVEGNLAEGVDLRKLLAALPATGVTEIRVRCGMEDSSSIREVVDTLEIPLYIDLHAEEVPALTLHQDGLNWVPRYGWSSDNAGNCSVEGTAVVSNSTGQLWNASMVRIEDAEGNSVAATSAGLEIPGGDLTVDWWLTRGRVGTLSLVYGWPVTGRWNTLLPLVVSSPGPVLQGGTGDELLVREGSDTVWVRADELLEMTEQMSQARNGYLYAMTVTNLTGGELGLNLLYPEMLPRGAVIRPGEGFESEIVLPPGGSRSMHYSIVYTAL
jgi:hypothetical protein